MSPRPRSPSLVGTRLGVVLWIASLALSPLESVAGEDRIADALRSILASGSHPDLRWSRFADHQGDLERLYEAVQGQPLWIRDARPTPQALAAIQALGAADRNGLRPGDYDADLLRRQGEHLAAGGLSSAETLARFDTALSLGLMRYASDVHSGRIDPQSLQMDLQIRPKREDLPELLRSMAEQDRVAETLAALEPPFPIYQRLKEALARYRKLAADRTLQPLPDMATLRPGERHPGVPALRRLLTALGDLPAAPPADARPQLYGGELVRAVRRFQRRHGLMADGVIGRATMAQLATPLRDRVQQIELTLERIRWLPSDTSRPHIVVNVPGFELYAFLGDSQREDPVLTTRVIVGEAVAKHQTPIFAEDMQYVIFRPYWNVPYSITQRELLPQLQRNPEYLYQHDYEIVRHLSDRGASYAPSPENLERLARGELRLRQRPGRQNALGPVKLIFPNNKNVYLHSTPARRLFSRSRRDFSHGCIRVEDAVGLTEFVLADNPGWGRERIERAMKAARTQRVSLARSIPVFILYMTAVVSPKGEVFFYDDIYGHDARLRRALSSPRPYPGWARAPT